MFGNNFSKKPKDDPKKDDKEKKAPDFSAEDAEELEQDEPDTVTLHPRAKDLVEKIIRMRKGL